MVSIYRGIVKGKVVTLPDDVKLSDGLVVEVHVEWPQNRSRKQLPAEDRFKWQLLKRGLLDEVRDITQYVPKGDRAPIKVKGKLLSELIIEERR